MADYAKWDAESRSESQEARGVDFADAATVLRDDRPRLISARPATPQEREQYGAKS